MVNKNKPYHATLRDLLALNVPDNVRVSPNGMKVAFTVQTTNWKDNRYERQCHIYDDGSGAMYQLTHYGNVIQMEWLNDETLALLKSNSGKSQVWLFEDGRGEGCQITDHKTGVEWFHPFAEGIIFQARQPEKDERKTRADQYGKYTHFEQEESASAVYYLDIQELLEFQRQTRAMTEEEGKKLIAPIIELSKLFAEPLAIKEIIVSPVGDTLYLNCWRRDDIVYLRETRIFQIKLNAKSALAKYLKMEKTKQAKKKDDAPRLEEHDKRENWSYLGKLSELKLPKGSRIRAVSPQGSELLIGYKERDQMLYTRDDLWVAPAQAVERARTAKRGLEAMTNLTAEFDREPMTVYWTEAGIFYDYIDSTRIRIAQIDAHGTTMPLNMGVFEFGDFDVSSSGHVVLIGNKCQKFC